MRWAPLVVVLAGCTRLLGIHDFDPGVTDFGACTYDTDCKAHEYCEGLSTCACVAGYGGNPCTWQGVVDDPGFASTAAWTPVGPATVDAAAATLDLLDPGQLELGACTAFVTQRITMPRFERAEPLVAQIVARTTNATFIPGSGGSAFALGGAWDELSIALPTTFATERRCLGAAHFASATSVGRGEPIELSVGQTVSGACHAIAIDHFEIVPADPGECPALGEVTNGAADADGGWIFEGATGAVAGFVDGVGENGSRAGRMTFTSECGTAAISVPMAPSLPSATGSPALAYYLQSTAMTASYTTLGEHGLTTRRDIAPTTVRLCVPANLRGVATRLRVPLAYTGGGTCTDPISADGTLDSVTLTDEPACGTDPAIADPGFESGFLATSSVIGSGSVQSIAPNGGTHSGTRMLQLAVTGCASQLQTEVSVVTPTGAGPALAFWTRTDGPATSVALRVYPRTFGTASPLAPQAAWHRVIVCLDPALAGRSQQVVFDYGTSCSSGALSEQVFVDDLEITADLGCPSSS